MLSFLIACALPPEEPEPEPAWAVDCDGWTCPDSSGIEYTEATARCHWECATVDGTPGQYIAVTFTHDGECWDWYKTETYDGPTCGYW